MPSCGTWVGSRREDPVDLDMEGANRRGRAPIGVFDSGIGGLSVLREVRRELPHEDLLYVADSRHAPYGERRPEDVGVRASAVVEFLVSRGAKAIVVACNTATSVAAEALRGEYPLPIVAIEPAIKPAVARTESGVVGVMATAQTLNGARFANLVRRYARGVTVLSQPCPGLVERVEMGDLTSTKTRTLVARYVRPLVERGADTIVLGCTHYPLLASQIQAVAGSSVTVLDSAVPVAMRVRQCLRAAGLLASGPRAGTEEFWTSGDPRSVQPVLEQLWAPGALVRALPGV